VIMVAKKETRVSIPFLLLSLVFLVYMMKSGHYFYHHNYYIIPFVPVMALVAGYAFSMIKNQKVFVFLLLVGVGESIANQQHDFFIKDSERYKMSLEQIMDKVTAPEDLILLNGNGNPQLFYLSHRKGWNCRDQQLTDSSFVEGLINQGCKYIVINKHSSAQSLDLEVVFENKDFLIQKSPAKCEAFEAPPLGLEPRTL
jgi:hypothetical protein